MTDDDETSVPDPALLIMVLNGVLAALFARWIGVTGVTLAVVWAAIYGLVTLLEFVVAVLLGLVVDDQAELGATGPGGDPGVVDGPCDE